MLEQAIQALESVLGPLLEAILSDDLAMIGPNQTQSQALARFAPFPSVTVEASAGTTNLEIHRADTEAALAGQGQGLPLPPLDAAACVGLLLKSEQLCLSKFPITIKKRLEVVEAVSDIASLLCMNNSLF